MKKGFLMLVMFLVTTFGFASTPELNQTLVRVINQINAILPLLDEAEGEIEPHARVQLHVNAFEGADGKMHPGVREDLLSIRNALVDYINKPLIAPRTVKPLAFDFIGK